MNTRIQKWCAAGSLVLALTLVLAPHMALFGQTLSTTQPVSGTVTAAQATAASLNATVVGTGTFATQAAQSGTWNITNVSGTVSLPTGASTAAKQPALGTAGSASADVITIQGIASMTKLLVTPDANSAINLAQVGGTNTVNGGVAGSQSVGGTVATNVAITANPLNLGAQGVSSENTAVTTARQVQLVADLVGKLIVLPYANPENFVSGAITSAMTSTTSTSLIAAPAAGLRNYVTNCVVSNSHATVGTDVILQDGSGGTTLYTLPAAPAYGGTAVTFPTPLRQPTTATALYAADVTTGASVKISCSGYKGA